MDDQKFHDSLNNVVGDLGAAVAASGVVRGDQLGLYAALADGPQSADVLAASTGTAARYVEEWVRAHSAGGYVEYDATTDTYLLTEEQAFALTTRTARCSCRAPYTRGETIGWPVSSAVAAGGRGRRASRPLSGALPAVGQRGRRRGTRDPVQPPRSRRGCDLAPPARGLRRCIRARAASGPARPRGGLQHRQAHHASG